MPCRAISDVQDYLVMAAGISPGTAQNAAAQELVSFVMSPAAMPTLKNKGMGRN